MLGLVIHYLLLNLRTQELPDIQSNEAAAFVAVAVLEETPRVPAELLVALAWGESRFKQDSGPGCGVMQVFPQYLGHPEWTCKVLRNDLVLAVRSGVEGLEQMLDDRRVRGDLYKALMYRACGNAFFDGTCSSKKAVWVKHALERWEKLAPSETRSSYHVRVPKPAS